MGLRPATCKSCFTSNKWHRRVKYLLEGSMTIIHRKQVDIACIITRSSRRTFVGLKHCYWGWCKLRRRFQTVAHQLYLVASYDYHSHTFTPKPLNTTLQLIVSLDSVEIVVSTDKQGHALAVEVDGGGDSVGVAERNGESAF